MRPPIDMTAPARALPPVLQRITFPVIGAPLFIISNPKLVIAQCTAGVVGAMPALNARPAAQLDEWLAGGGTGGPLQARVRRGQGTDLRRLSAHVNPARVVLPGVRP